MVKTVTFSVGTKYGGSSETETFTFEKLGIDEDMDDTEVKKRNRQNFSSLGLG